MKRGGFTLFFPPLAPFLKNPKLYNLLLYYLYGDLVNKDNKKTKTIRVSQNSYNRLCKLGDAAESMDDVLQKLFCELRNLKKKQNKRIFGGKK